LYHPAARQQRQLSEHDLAGAKHLADWKQRVRQAWPKVALRPLTDPPPEMPRKETLSIRVAATLSGLQPSDVRVEFVGRRRLPESNFDPPPLSSYRPTGHEGLWTATLTATGEHESDGAAIFAVNAQPPACGQFATEIRIYPSHELLAHPYELGLMKWL
jgi:starch phosphorylase